MVGTTDTRSPRRRTSSVWARSSATVRTMRKVMLSLVGGRTIGVEHALDVRFLPGGLADGLRLGHAERVRRLGERSALDRRDVVLRRLHHGVADLREALHELRLDL